MPFGPMMQRHEPTTTSKPCSRKVGMSGAMKCRSVAETPRIFSLPALCCSMVSGTGTVAESTSPRHQSDHGRGKTGIGHAGDLDVEQLLVERHARCRTSRPAASLPFLILPGLARARST